MKNYKILLVVLMILPCLLSAQSLQLAYEKSVVPDFFDYFMSAQKRQFYLSADGSRVLLNTEQKYLIMDMHSEGTTINEGKHVMKVTDLSASIMGMLKNKSLNREDAINTLNFKEGTEYYVFEEEGIILFLDWNVEKNIVKAVDLNTGALLWETDRYRYTPTAAAQFANEFVGAALSQTASSLALGGISVAEASLIYLGERALNSNAASSIARAFIVPFPTTGMFMLKTRSGYVGITLKSGEERWTYDEGLVVGFSEVVSPSEAVLVNFNASYFKSSKNILTKLDLNTGKEVWRATHLSDFKEGRTYVVGDRIVCDYYGAEVFDLNTGERLLLSIDERTVKAQNTMGAMFMNNADGTRSTTSIASPSAISGSNLYTSTFKLGPRVYANDGSSKAMIQKYDLKTGDRVWESQKLSKGTDLSYASADHVFVRKGKAFGKSSMYILDAGAGSLMLETETIDGFVYREGAGDVLADDQLYRSGKKSVYAFDLASWNMNEFAIKATGVGKLIANAPAGENLMIIGDKGVTFFSPSGKSLSTTLFNVTSCAWNNEKCFLFNPSGTQVVDINTFDVLLNVPTSPEAGDLVLLDEEGDAVVVVENENNNAGKKVLKYYRD